MFNILDLVIIAILLLSAVLAAWRGFTREVLSIGAWVGAAIVMFLLGPKAVPFAAEYVEKGTIAMIVAYATVFVLALIPLAYVSYRIAEGVRESAIGPVDRLLGFAFGAARGLLIVGIGYLVFVSLAGSKKPDWFTEARLHPLMEATARVITAVLPARDGASPPSAAKEDETIIGGPKPAAKPAPRDEVAPEPEAKPAPAKPAPPKPAPPKPKPPKVTEPAETPKPVAKRAPAKEDAADPAKEEASASASPRGYGEREREALDQLIGTATASPGDGAAD